MSKNSGTAINYTVRPAKNVERKMMRDSLFRLFPFGDITEYRYIGFGAKYFADFTLFHKHLHIEDMVSIEKSQDTSRYEFNRPFGCIKVVSGSSNEILPNLEFEKKVICWLDYDSRLSNTALADIATLLEKSQSGSVIALSYNAEPLKLPELKKKYGNLSNEELYKLELKEVISDELIPFQLPRTGLSKKITFSKVLRQIVFNQIEKTLLDINSTLSKQDQWIFSQIWYFNYKDGAAMSTIGGIFYQEKDRDTYDLCSFEALEFVRTSDEAYEIEVPNLTIKEVNALLECMPLVKGEINREKLPKKIFSDSDIQKFSKIYKYFPNFSEIEST